MGQDTHDAGIAGIVRKPTASSYANQILLPSHYGLEHAFCLAVDHIDRNQTTIRHPQANTGPEYFDQAMSYGFSRVAFRREID